MASAEPITLDHQSTHAHCAHCKEDYLVSRGSFYRQSVPFGLYVAGLHACKSGSGSMILAVALRPAIAKPPISVSIQVWLVDDEYQMHFLEPSASPWQSHTYLGPMLPPDAARASEHRATFFQLADCVVGTNPSVIAFFTMLSHHAKHDESGA